MDFKRALPPLAPLSMPRHEVDEPSQPLRPSKEQTAFLLSTWCARLFVALVSTALSYYGVTEMYAVLSTNTITMLQWLFLVLFSINFCWVAFAFSQALLGFLIKLKPRILRPPEAAEAPFKTAVLFPIYKEEPTRIAAAIEVMRAELSAAAPGKYAFFILSDTNEANAWLTEEQAFLPLFDDNEGCPVFYRRRAQNHERKAGNIAHWVENWGADYEAMIVLDADSIMSADTMLSLSRRMAAAPEVGLIQTLPTIVYANSLYGKLQQFANHCFGPIYAEGLSAWHGLSSNFWGHNAIIRTEAFAQCAGLPVLSGKPPFGGHVLSHDFIEAALLRRAGWGVRFDTDIQGSYEEAPPSLTDVLVRDRRWCQGNLQHGRLFGAQGLALGSRIHILSGIMSYMSAVFWLALIVVGLAIAVVAQLTRPEYFANPSLFPNWPVFDAERALQLFVVSMAVVLAPKVFGWAAAMVNWRQNLAFGGPILLTLSVIFESLMSALYAPILMVAQFKVVWNIFRGKDSGWNPQARDDGALSWRQVYQGHRGHTLFGLILGGIAYAVNIDLFYWLLPITGGLILSIPLSWVSGGENRMKVFTWFGLLQAPEEKRPRPVLSALSERLQTLEIAETVQQPLQTLQQQADLCGWHCAQLPLLDGFKPDEFHSATVTAEWKIKNAESLVQLEQWLEPAEMLALLCQSGQLNLLQQRGLIVSSADRFCQPSDPQEMKAS